ncbi:hypothetical protein [Gordonia sp. SL306]|nr:hypothetical protein [Gordonia sp. SL306]WAC55524.1 hypothetical protein OVA31_23555 [Gordonia sp. SL306]
MTNAIASQRRQWRFERLLVVDRVALLPLAAPTSDVPVFDHQ